jgi:hypothetical protein
MMTNLRLVLGVEVAPGNQHTSKHSSPRLWELLDGLSNQLRPWLLQAIGRQTSHAGRTTMTITSSHGENERARTALRSIAGFFVQLRKTAEQLTALERWYRILSQALKKFLRGRKLVPPRQLPAGAASYG